MRYIKHRSAKFATAVVGVVVMATVASRQLYLFVVFRSAQGLSDMQGGRYHLWLALGASLIACVAGCFMFLFFLRYGAQGKPLRVS
jgi:hypothetical protein